MFPLPILYLVTVIHCDALDRFVDELTLHIGTFSLYLQGSQKAGG
jgi:hypothetical protein